MLEIDGVDLNSALATADAWSTVYTSGPQGEPPGAVESRTRSLQNRMQEAGVPEDDASALAQALPDDAGLPAPSARWLLARDGAVLIDVGWASPPRGGEHIAHGPFPAIVPLLRHRVDEPRILVVETSRDAADLSLQRLGRGSGDEDQRIEGEDFPITKVHAGGMSQARFQRSVDETWQRNQTEVAEEVDRLVRERQPAHIFVSGDVQARRLLLERIGAEAQALVVEVDADTRAAGSDDTALIEAIDETVGAAHRARLSDLRDRAAERDGQNGAVGISAVVTALQQAQVETLLLDERMPTTTLLALQAEPWIAVTAADSFEAGEGIELPAIEALARAAMLTDAEVVFVEHTPAEGETVDEDPSPPLAVLRWGQELSPATDLTGGS